MSKIPTAEELIDNNQKQLYKLIEQFSKKEITEDEFYKMSGPFLNISATKSLMIHFAKIHVIEALKIAKEKAREVIDNESILNAYPLENIK